MTILVTGGCGFIGSNFVREYLTLNSDLIINLDKLTYAGNPKNLEEFNDQENYLFYEGDIADSELVEKILKTHPIDCVVNFAAESHVDNSISNSTPFLYTNVIGTVCLLESIRKFSPETLFVHVSTDEVYGSLSEYDPPFTEKTPYNPRSPYSASKAASDHFVMAYHHTHRLNTIITNCSNNYGAYQHAEKFIPTIIRKALKNEKIPVYGSGTNIRDWIYVKDHCYAIMDVMERGKIGQTYNIGGNNQISNLGLVKKIIDIMGKSENLIEFVDDRKGHDFRYDIDNDKIYLHLGWKPTTNFDVGLKKTIEWYTNNLEWIESCRKPWELS